jgi:hypothetical protein
MNAALWWWIGGALVVVSLAGWRLRRAAQKVRRILAEELENNVESSADGDDSVRNSNTDDPPEGDRARPASFPWTGG